MRPSRAPLCLALSVPPAFASAAPAASPAAITSSAADRTAVAVTVYNDGRGLVREERAVALPAGVAELRFMDVAEKVEAPTVRVAVLEGGALSVLEQNYEYDLLSPQKLLEKFVGREVTLVRERLRESSSVDEEVTGRLLSTNAGTVWEIGGRIVTNPAYSRLLFPDVPQNLIAKPTLVWVVEAARAGKRRLEAAYLTQGMSWRADYVMALDASETRAGLTGWVTIDNQSGAGYADARLKLVAGDVHRAPEEAPQTLGLAARPAARAAAVQEEAFFEYHLYTLPRPTTLKEKQTKQVQLLDAAGVAVAKDYVLRGSGAYYRGPWHDADPKEPVAVFLKLRNEQAAGLGMPLPKGIVRVYKRDASGSPQFVGEDRIEHTPKDEELRLELGNAFDVAAERRQTDFRKLSERVFESAYEVRIRNHKEAPITVRALEPVGGDWTMVQNSHPFRKTSAFEVEFTVPAAAGQEAVLTYRVRVTY